MNKPIEKYCFEDFLTKKIKLIGDDGSSGEDVKIDEIVIPMIQRDYAQGRKIHFELDKMELNPTGKKFINDIFLTLMSDDKQLELDFVYGSIKGKKEIDAGKEKEMSYFEPLDGQQRLTTLFLLYWFVGGAELDPDRKNLAGVLKNFTYKTRRSSTEFCEGLVNELRQQKREWFTDDAKDNAIADKIQDLSWFHDSYKLDSTVQSMLNMLDEIQRLYLFHECKNIFDKLEKLRFYVLPLSNFDLTEELYVKMNARGKPLTEFEKFKADLQDLIKTKLSDQNRKYCGREMSYDMYFINKIDNEWTQYFWNVAKEIHDTQKHDALFMSFVYKYTLNEYILDYLETGNTNKKLDKEPDFKTLEGERGSLDVTRFEKYFDKERLNNLEVLLDKISGNKNAISKAVKPCWKSDQKDILNCGDTITIPERVVLCAILMHLIKKDFKESAFNDWLRVIWNIVENADIDSWRVGAGVIDLVKELVEHSEDIIGWLADDKNSIESGIAKDQMNEERWKARLIKKDDKWKDKLIAAEKHPFFKGSVSFLIPKDENIDGFEHNLKMAKKLFVKDGVSDKFRGEGHLFLRGLLSRYKNLGEIQYYITDRDDKEKSLKKMLRSDNVVRTSLAEWLSLETEEDLLARLRAEVEKESPIALSETGDDFDKKLHQTLYRETDLITWMQLNGAIRYKDNYISRPNSFHDWIYVRGYRNEIIEIMKTKGWECEDKYKCSIDLESGSREIPFYKSHFSPIKVTKSCDGKELGCVFDHEHVDLYIGNDSKGKLEYQSEVKKKEDIEGFVEKIEREFEKWCPFSISCFEN